VVCALGAAVWLGVSDAPPTPPRAPSPTPVAPATPSPPPTAAARSLAVGITEPNPNFLWPAGREVAAPFGRWRDSLARIRPAYYRLMVDWRDVQPSAGAPPDLNAEESGCMRAERPCAGWAGVRDQLRALAARQREGGWDGMVVITGTPDWAAQPAGGCERPGATARSRRVRAEALPAYRRLVAALIAAGRQEGARLTYWSPWNEPNHPYFLSPQRSECDRSAPSGAAVMYTELARAMVAELDAAEGDQRLVLGELAGLAEPTRYRTTVAEFIAGLPRDLVCRAAVWGQHAYAGGADPVDEAATGLADHGCPRVPPIWITETGAGTPPEELAAARAFDDEREACGELQRRLEAWYEDPRVAAAFQYTLREDDRFRTGLVTTDLQRARIALGLWEAWGARDSPGDPPPAAACGGR
jgi:hypothetical protein